MSEDISCKVLVSELPIDTVMILLPGWEPTENQRRVTKVSINIEIVSSGDNEQETILYINPPHAK